MKKYIAKTNVSINVVLTSGTNRHIAFSPLTGGGSVFYTEDPELIQAMERHYRFGTLFRVDTSYVAEMSRSKPVVKTKPTVITKQPTVSTTVPNAAEADTFPEASGVAGADAEVESEPLPRGGAGANDQTENGESIESECKRVVVTDPDSAKSYLAEHYGYSRTKIKTVKAINEAAAAHGIVFEGI